MKILLNRSIPLHRRATCLAVTYRRCWYRTFDTAFVEYDDDDDSEDD